MLMGIAEDTPPPPQEYNKLLDIDMGSNVGINFEGFDMDFMGDSFGWGYIQSERISDNPWE